MIGDVLDLSLHFVTILSGREQVAMAMRETFLHILLHPCFGGNLLEYPHLTPPNHLPLLVCPWSETSCTDGELLEHAVKGTF